MGVRRNVAVVGFLLLLGLTANVFWFRPRIEEFNGNGHLCWFITLVPDMAMDKYLPNNPKEEEILAPVLSVTVIHPTIPLKDLDVAPFIVISG